MSRTSVFTARDPDRYRVACAFVIAIRVAIDSSIQQGDPETPTHQRRHAASRTFLHEATNRSTRTILMSQRALCFALVTRVSLRWDPFHCADRNHAHLNSPKTSCMCCRGWG